MSLELGAEIMLEASPYSFYERLRDEAPVQLVRRPDGLEIWLISRYDDGRAVLTDPRFSNDLRHAEDAMRQASIVSADDGEISFGRTMVTMDPPDHTRLRRLVGRAFTVRRIDALRPRILEIANELVDGFARRGRADLMPSFAYPLPTAVICELLGIPLGEQETFKTLNAEMTRMADSEENRERQQRGMRDMRTYVSDLIARKRTSLNGSSEDGQPDLLSALIIARDEGSELTEPELVGMTTLLLVAGHDTTVNLIGNGILALLQHPEQLRLLRSQPEQIVSAVDEFLRYDPPVQQPLPRVALEDVVVGDVTIPAGAVVGVVLGSGCRDPKRFSNADRLDITRGDGQHLAFGFGRHYCLGAPLARLEAQIGIATLLRRIPDLTLAVQPGELSWRPGSMYFRGVTGLPVEFTPTSMT